MNTTQDIVSNSDLRVEPAFKRIKTDSSPLKNITHSTSPLKTRETPYFQGINVGLATPEVKKSGDRVIPSSCESTKTAATVHVSYDLDQEIIKHQRSGLQRGMAMTNIPSLNRTPSPERSHSRLSILSNATSVTELGSQDQVEWRVKSVLREATISNGTINLSPVIPLPIQLNGLVKREGWREWANRLKTKG